MEKRKRSSAKKEKANKPKRAMTPYFHYLMERRAKFVEENPKMKNA